MITVTRRITRLEADAMDFAPAIVRTQATPPSPLPRAVLYALLVLFAAMLAWAALGQLDVVAVAQGKLVPQSFLKIVQPAESGIVREILVREGETVREGQPLIRMDARLSEADRRIVENELKLKALQLRRIDAELAGVSIKRRAGDAEALYSQVQAQYRARRQAHLDMLETERALVAKAQQDLMVALEIENKLKKTVPIYRDQAEGWDKLAREGFAGRLMAQERQRQLIENEQDLRAQAHNIASLRATITQSEKRISQITSNYGQQLQNERVETAAQHHRLQRELEKIEHRSGLLELRAPQGGVVKDLATHTPGTVVAPGTVLMTLVPRDEPVIAEVWIANIDAGFVQAGQTVRVKVAPFPFQRYGMVDGIIRQVSADSTERADAPQPGRGQPGAAPLSYRALVELKALTLARDGVEYPLAPGMQVNAEIHLGTRSVLEYMLSPIRKVAHDAARER
jgi:hemolysin D